MYTVFCNSNTLDDVKMRLHSSHKALHPLFLHKT